jgi:hypothetical protein
MESEKIKEKVSKISELLKRNTSFSTEQQLEKLFEEVSNLMIINSENFERNQQFQQ